MYRCNVNRIERFKQAQANNSAYDTYFQNAKNGQSQIPWEWFVFPCLDVNRNLFHTDIRFIQNKNEAILYWNDPILKKRLCNITELILQRNTHDAFDIFGSPDYLLVHSSMTLFFAISHDVIFRNVIDKFYGGTLCEYTIRHTEPKWKLATEVFIKKI